MTCAGRPLLPAYHVPLRVPPLELHEAAERERCGRLVRSHREGLPVGAPRGVRAPQITELRARLVDVLPRVAALELSDELHPHRVRLVAVAGHPPADPEVVRMLLRSADIDR